jgi:NAD(P)-dependent dehydrogenase (short-subunit alcohol dehydrogenase family)
MTGNALAGAGHTVYASMRETEGRNAPQVQEIKEYGQEQGVDLRAVERDVSSQQSTDQAIAGIIRDNDRLDVVVHNAGHMVYGPTESFHARTARRALRHQCFEHSAR